MSTQNQNQPPQSNKGESPLNQNKGVVIERATKRPILVWLISIFFVGTVVIFDTFFIARLLGYGSNSEFAVNHLSTYTAADYLRRLVGGVLSLAAGIYLFLLRKIAVRLFEAIFVINCAYFLYEKYSGGTPTTFFNLLSLFLMYLYTLRLKRQGILV